jgi:ribosomal-protein-alanine N-acetyltransferase
VIELQDRPLTPAEARGIASWAYEPPFDLYDLVADGAVDLLTARDGAGSGYYPLQDGDAVVGFVCFGAEARVSGQREEPGTCDVGMGLAPTSLSQGVGTGLLPVALLFAVEKFAPRRVRAAVAAFNERSLRLCTSAGFRTVREFEGPGNRRFVELALDLYG